MFIIKISSASSLANFMQERDCCYTPARSIFCLSHIWVQADIPVWKIVLHALDPGCSMALLWSFHPAVVSLLSPEKLSDNHPLGEAPATWLNKYNWFKRVMSSDKKTLAWNRICWCKLQSHLNSVPFLQQCSKVVSEKNAFSTAKNILDFFSILVYT